MKKLLLILGILILVACVIFLLLAALKLSAYRNLVDATPEHYENLMRSSTVHAVIGVILAAAGAACLIIRAKL